jgi:hypothetical protein
MADTARVPMPDVAASPHDRRLITRSSCRGSSCWGSGSTRPIWYGVTVSRSER